MGLSFDRFVFIDWSASSRPKIGRDSIWIAEGDHQAARVSNPATRRQATDQVRRLLRQAVDAGQRVLVGFDFPYGYPAGLARTLGLRAHAPPWRQVWDELSRLIVDDARNSNNRFDVAATLNRRIAELPGPFWGLPSSLDKKGLSPRRGQFVSMAEYRITETRLRASGKQVSSAWKLFTQPTVGSQALLGIPYLAELRDDDVLTGASLVWPFETGFTATPGGDAQPLILHCEIWPGVIPTNAALHAIRDAAQMLTLVQWAAGLSAGQGLASLFVPNGVTKENAAKCVSDEGWILGA